MQCGLETSLELGPRQMALVVSARLNDAIYLDR
jgi:hypothetical protein